MISAQRVVIRIGMAEDVPALNIGELGWDVDKKRLRAGDGTPTPPMIMTTKSTDAFEYKFIRYVEYPEIRMLPEGTVDGVDISDLNRNNGFVVRRGDNLWAQRTLQNSDTYITIDNPAGTAGDPVFNLSQEVVDTLFSALQEVAVDDVTIHGNGRVEAPLYAHSANYTEKGVTRFATGPETADGVLGSVAITPESLLHRTSTFARTGIIRKATLAEVRAAVDTDSVVVPAYLKTATNEFITEWMESNGSDDIAYRGPILFSDSGRGDRPNNVSVAGWNYLEIIASGTTSQNDGGTESFEFYVGNKIKSATSDSNPWATQNDTISVGITANWKLRRGRDNTWYFSSDGGVVFVDTVGSGDTLRFGLRFSFGSIQGIQVHGVNQIRAK